MSFINTIKYYDENGEKQNISSDYKKLLFEDLFLKKDKNFQFEEIRKFLDKKFKDRKRYNYPINQKEKIYDSSVSGMPVCKGLITVFGDAIKGAIATIETYHIGNAPKIIQDKYSIYDLWHILLEFDELHLEGFAIQKLEIENEKNKKGEEFNRFAKLKSSFSPGYADLCLKAMCRIIPFLKEGYLYNEAVVLAKIPELLGEKWEHEKDNIRECAKKSNETYQWNKTITEITNNLIDQYKGLEPNQTFAFKDYQYTLDNDDINDIETACIGFFGEKTWRSSTNKEQVLANVKLTYQFFFQDRKRAYKELPSLTDLFKAQLKTNKIEINGELYHHATRENKYLKKCIDIKTGEIKLPVDKKAGVEILPEPRIDSVKNPMFNKAMNILRKLVNELIRKEMIDEDTEVIVEIARELNDNNKRAAIERYQREREVTHEKYRDFLKEFKEKENHSINIDESINILELWTEQTFEETKNEKKEKVNNTSNIEILKENDAVKRYELWMEQKGQCMYTGRMIPIALLFSNEIDIAHTIPRSLLPDNTMANVTICYARYNRDFQKTKTPYYCDNYSEDKPIGTAILPRLEKWTELRDNWKRRHEKNLRASGNEDEAKKNKRIQEKHYCKMHYNYWHDKVDRFTAEEVKASWARRQLVDTQMICKYAREFLQTYFKKVAVQKGIVTADFRKIYSFQEEDEIKSRNRHTHHAIDAAVLTLIPANSSQRDKMLNKMYQIYETEKRQYTTVPFSGFNSQKLIENIDNNTLIVNLENDKILKKTYKNVRKRGKLQYLKDKEGNFVLDKGGNKISLRAKGDTARSSLYAATYLGKIKDVERYDDEQPIRKNGNWKYKTGKDEFIFVKRENIDKVKTSDKLIDTIVDPVIKTLVRSQKNKAMITDFQGNVIRHVRIKTNAGKEVKQRLNYRSKHDYKNKFYSEAGSLPYAILLQRSKTGEIQREMIPIPSFEIVKMYKRSGSFDIEQYVKKNYAEFSNYPDKKLLKVGQKVIVLKDDEDYEKRLKLDFQINRLYTITQFSEGSIWMKYHLEAQSKDEVKEAIANLKDKILRKYEDQLQISEISEDNSIDDKMARKEDFENKRYRFDTLARYRFQRIKEKIGIEKTKEIKKELDKFKAISGSIEIEGKTPLLKMSKENWNFFLEGYDFDISLLGELKWLAKQ